MAAKWIELVTGSLEQKKQYRQYKARIEALPEPYGTVAKALQRYFMYYGGNSEMHGYDYLQFVGHNAVYADAELRFPLIEAMLTPIGVLGGIRGVLFFNTGLAGFNGQDYSYSTTKDETVRPVVGFEVDPVRALRDLSALSLESTHPVFQCGSRIPLSHTRDFE
jgi:outer membrane protein assembly factor BamA